MLRPVFCFIVGLAALSCLPLASLAQLDSNLAKRIQALAKIDPIYSLSKGAWAHLHVGVTAAGFGSLAGDVKPKAGVVDSFQFAMRPLGTMIGGSIGGILKKKFIASLSITHTNYTESESPKGGGTLRMRHLSYGLQLGYAILNKEQYLLYPYIGYQMGRATFTLTNYSTDSLFFGGQPTDILRSSSYTTTTSTIELGLALRRTYKSTGHLMLGAEVGGYYTTGNGWQAGSGTNPTASSPGIVGGYLRISIGAGIFTTEKYTGPVRKPRTVREDPAPQPNNRSTAPADAGTDTAKPSKKKPKVELLVKPTKKGKDKRPNEGKEDKKKKKKSDDYDDSEFEKE